MSWPVVAIGDCVEKTLTWNPLLSESKNEFAYIDLSSVDKEKKEIVQHNVASVLPADAPSRARQLVKSNDVLVATVRPNLNGVALVPDQYDGATASTGYCVLRPKIKKLDSQYLYYWVQTGTFVTDMMEKATGANYPAVSDKIIKQSKIPLPSLPEQKRIAAILDKADAIRRKRQQVIQLADEFLRAVFLDMFGDPVTNPRGWDCYKLEDLVSKPITYGILKPEEFVSYGIPMLRIQDLKNGAIDVKSEFHLVSEKLSGQYKRTVLGGGEIVISLVGSIGIVARVPLELKGSNVHRNLGVIKLKDSSVAEYVASFMQLPQFMTILERVSKGGVHKLLNLADLKEVEIPIPTMGMIEKYTAIKEHVSGLIAKSKAAEKELIFEALSQKAFSGEL